MDAYLALCLLQRMSHKHPPLSSLPPPPPEISSFYLWVLLGTVLAPSQDVASAEHLERYLQR